MSSGAEPALSGRNAGAESRSPENRNASKTPMITIAVDAMGGDNAPRPEVEGSVLAARELGVRVLLVGQDVHHASG